MRCSVIFQRFFSVFLVNYTGSIGFGDASIEELEGQIGVRDVEDCYVIREKIMT